MSKNVGMEDRLGRQLYVTWKLVRDAMDATMAPEGGSVPYWVVLRCLAAEPGLSHRELAGRMELTGPTLTHHLDRLEADGFIARRRDRNDRRVVRVELTAAGKRRREELDAVATRFDAALRALVGERKADTLHELLAELHDRLSEQEGENR